MSIIKVRERLGARMRDEESGFTLVELLVVMLILGLLAAIAIPAFFNQRDKARDADAKSSARTAQTAIETWATDNGGEYIDGSTSPDKTALVAIEPTLTDADLTVASTADTYSVSVKSDTENTFTISRLGTGATELTCTGPSADPGDGTEGSGDADAGHAGCPSSGNWGGD